MTERRRVARRAGDKIAQLYLARDHIEGSRHQWLAAVLDFGLTHPLAALGAAFVAGYAAGLLSRLPRTY